MANRSTKKAVGIRITQDAVTLLKGLAEKNGLSQVGVIELAIREKAAREGVKLEKKSA